VAANVDPESMIGCDDTTCAALAARGYPADSLIRLTWRDGDIRRSEVALVTGAVRARFGAGLADRLSPQRLAVFGTGPSAVEVAPVVLASRQAHAEALAADLDSRRAAGRKLITNPRLTVTAEARRLLAAGRVDSRVLILLEPLLAKHRIQVSALRGSPEETALGVPLRIVDIGRIDGRRVDPASFRARDVAGVARDQRPPYGPATVTFPRPRPVLRIAFPAPAPLGLMSPR
jgi:hypothetical protein